MAPPLIQPLFVDLYQSDLDGKPDLQKLVDAGEPWCGIVLKASEGVNWGTGAWFSEYWKQAHDLTIADQRFGANWFRGCYHYVHFVEDPIKQADFYLKTVEAAGGFVKGDLWPVLDVERADNPDCSAAQIEDSVSKIAASLFQRTGKMPTLYGGSLMYDKSITSHMGCGRLWIPRYTATLPPNIYMRIGWHFEELLMWQYDGDSLSYLDNYPKVSPIGKADISALVANGGLNYLQNQLS